MSDSELLTVAGGGELAVGAVGQWLVLGGPWLQFEPLAEALAVLAQPS
ncbi:MAG: hypothetical protein ACYDBJ_15035 [Aggregatilineales bacterium]